MKDELVRSASIVALVSIAIWFSGCCGCNGCSGCTGQTTDPSPQSPQTVNSNDAEIESSSSITQNAETAPSASSAVSAGNANPGYDPTGVRRCCKSIEDNLAAAPRNHKATWATALGACNVMAKKNTGRKGLEVLRKFLTPVGWPAACQ